jgi:heterodisulfide reductase subunit A-like polyferredoxin
MSNPNPEQAHDNSLNSGQSALVLGGGFAGVEAASPASCHR